MEVINTQWLYRQQVELVKETATQIVVKVPSKTHVNGFAVKRFWKRNGYELGYSKIFKKGNEPDKLIGL